MAQAVPNSHQGPAAPRPPASLLAALASAAAAIPSPYITIDVAEVAGLAGLAGLAGVSEGRWIVLEAGDGGVSGPGPGQCLREHWALLYKHFQDVEGEPREGSQSVDWSASRGSACAQDAGADCGPSPAAESGGGEGCGGVGGD